MSDTIELEDDAQTRRPRSLDTRRVEVDSDAAVTVGDHDDTDPEAMLAASKRALEEKDRQLAAAKTAAATASANAARARDEAARANMGRATDRAAAVASAIEAAKADQTAAKIALRTARETGDLDAEMAAQEMLQSALYRGHQASGELNWINQQAKAAPAQTTPQRSAAAQAWLDSHPRFETDPAYRATAEGAHTAALRAGLREGSQEYVDHIDRIVSSVHGDGTADDAPLARTQPMRQDPPRSDTTSYAGATNRGGGGSSSGSRTVQTLFGPVGVVKRGGAIVQVSLPQPGTEKRADWEEAASIAGMDLGMYAREQVLIAEERASGGTGGLVQTEGSTAR